MSVFLVNVFTQAIKQVLSQVVYFRLVLMAVKNQLNHVHLHVAKLHVYIQLIA